MSVCFGVFGGLGAGLEEATVDSNQERIRTEYQVRVKGFLVEMRHRGENEPARSQLVNFIDPECLLAHGVTDPGGSLGTVPVVNNYNFGFAKDFGLAECSVNTGVDCQREFLLLRLVRRDGQVFVRPEADSGYFDAWILRMDAS